MSAFYCKIKASCVKMVVEKFMEKTLISVIVPIYKVEQYLDRCIASILNQTYKDMEIILVDDGSPDGCGKMCDDYAKADKRIKVIHKQNGGLMAAWIDGVKKSTGEFIYFIDSDDWIELESVENYVKIIKEHNPDLIINDFFIAEGEDKKQFAAVNSSKFETEVGMLLTEDAVKEFKDELVYRHLRVGYYRWNKIFRRNLITDNFKYLDTNIVSYEDVNICFASMLDAKSIYIEKTPTYNYFVRPSSMIRTGFNEKSIENSERLLRALYNILVGKELEYKYYISDRNLWILMILIESVVNDKKSTRKQKNKNLDAILNSGVVQNDYKSFVLCNAQKDKKLVYKLFVKRRYFFVKMLCKLAKIKHGLRNKKRKI